MTYFIYGPYTYSTAPLEPKTPLYAVPNSVKLNKFMTKYGSILFIS